MKAEVRRMSNAEYHADLSAVSKTMLSVLVDSGTWDYWDAFEKPGCTGGESKSSDYLDIGGLVDALLFEPRELANYVEIPASVTASNGHRRGNAWDQFAAKHQGKSLMKPEDIALANMLANKLRVVASDWLSIPGHSQLAIYWECPYTGILCRCRPDKLIERPAVYDLKTTEALKRFESKAKMFKYWLQDAHYSAGVAALLGQQPEEFVFGAIETTGRYRYQEFTFDYRTRSAAQRRYIEVMEQLAECRETGEWGSPDILKPSEMSIWL